ncbi:CHAD domain-containing protein [Saccharopolyspora griseoalba]|uniref:CHAD domain-containing protein n=1 Tax=Saccharopolyspora griseoalba TaxID=1431848 RepID=A0ABW2LKY2_9PSEU
MGSGGVVKQVRSGLATRLAALREHAPGTREGSDPEELHQMRVSVRRMRAMLQSARPFLDRERSEPLRAELGWLGRALGPVRDLDVLLEHLREEAADLPEQEAAARLLAGLDAEYAHARGDLLAALDSDRYRELLARLEAATEGLPAAKSESDGGEKALRDLVLRQFRKLREDVDALDADPPDERLHALRIRGKKVRYTAELAEPALGKPVRRLIKAAKNFQDVLGEHQDACVAEQRLRELAGGSDAEAAFVAGRLVEREELRKADRRARWPEAWAKLAEEAQQLRGGSR